MRHGSLFSGIGGFDLAAEWMGWENVFHCEWNEFGQKILKHYWPNAISYGDITKTDFTIHRGGIDILTGGFPCQPYSMAGKRLGKEDDRHLWPEMLRAIREIKPTWVVGENVHGIVSWNGGLVFDEVQTDLEAEGYEVQPIILPACSVNAPHRRDRVWFIAHPNFDGFIGSDSEHKINPSERGIDALNDVEHINTSDSKSERLERHNERFGCSKYRHNEGLQFGSKNKQSASNSRCGIRQDRIYGNEPKRKAGEPGNRDKEFRYFDNFPTTQPTIRRGDDGFSAELDGITFPKWRNESIKAYGNAIVPQVVYEIFKAIEKYETHRKRHSEGLC